MKMTFHKIAAVLLFAGASLAGTAAQAQKTAQNPKTIGGAVQQGNGAYVQKTDRAQCMGNELLGVPKLASGCVNMTQVKFMVTPSGNSTSVWKGTVPAESRPAQRVTFNSTYTESADVATKGKVYDTVAITEPGGDITLTLTSKANGKGKDNGRKM